MNTCELVNRMDHLLNYMVYGRTDVYTHQDKIPLLNVILMICIGIFMLMIGFWLIPIQFVINKLHLRDIKVNCKNQSE